MPARFAYSVFGLRLASNRQLPGLSPIHGPATSASDICIEFLEQSESKDDSSGETLWYTTDILNEQGEPGLKIWKRQNTGESFIRYINGLTFCLDAAIQHVLVSCAQPMSHGEVCSFLLGPVMGIALRMRGTTCLHASGVEINGRAVAFAGAMGAGKSTTAAIFAQRGHPVLADDIVTLEKCASTFVTRPAYPFLNLLPDSVGLAFGTNRSSECADSEIEKAQVMLEGRNLRFQGQSLALGSIYILERADQLAAARIDPIRPQEAFMQLASHTYANKILDQEMRSREFQILGELVKSMPVRRLIAPTGAAGVEKLYRMVLEDVSSELQPRNPQAAKFHTA